MSTPVHVHERPWSNQRSVKTTEIAEIAEISEAIPGMPPLLLAGAEDDDGAEPHICRGID